MMRFCNDYCSEESIYEIIHPPPQPISRNPMYISRYSQKIQNDAFESKIGCSRTIGPPYIRLEPPEQYLKKYSKKPLSTLIPGVPRVQLCPIPVKLKKVGRSEGSNSQSQSKCSSPKTFYNANGLQNQQPCHQYQQQQRGQGDFAFYENEDEEYYNSNLNQNQTCIRKPSKMSCGENCSKRIADNFIEPCSFRRRLYRKPVVPTSFDTQFGIIPRGYRDYIRDNAVNAIRLPAKIPRARYVDQVTGNCCNWPDSGFARKYLWRQDYGLCPGYLEHRKMEIQENIRREKEREEKRRREKGKRCRHLEEGERQKLLSGLKENWMTTFREFMSLPLKIDTNYLIARREFLEDKLKEIEQNIQTLERHNHIFVADTNKSFYLNNNPCYL